MSSRPEGLMHVPLPLTPLTRKDFTSDQDVRWCPGCGDYAVLAAFQGLLPELGIARENLAVISGIGCSSRFPYYVDSYGMHSIHGRAPAIATGLATARPDLSVWVVTGDGDALSIGGNHLVHALRRNVNITVLLFNNRIYGLTKGQYSPTSQPGLVTKSTPFGSVDAPLNPVSLALGAEATFVARSLDSNRAHLTGVLRAAAAHRGAALVEIYQNCPIFNDGPFDGFKGASESAIWLTDGQPITFADGRYGIVQGRRGLEIAEVSEAGLDAVLVHDSSIDDPTRAFALSRLTDSAGLTQAPFGVFRDVSRPAYDDLVRDQIAGAREGSRGLQAVLAGHDTWTV
ncbi:2-oxoacid:ferredoxin oxidoreductase subunit beta [Propionicicella superfundia]|uniref:2-oxoacid:ferredoxin oxidoreductase subunit beta n=1 Tax=Propionicicella superfundia TaxID=348582 RepID=UPI000403C4CF|nr:2-oxoacid:ferredoxin oxidoreductase subunit beta [Propionicicella superfundia]